MSYTILETGEENGSNTAPPLDRPKGTKGNYTILEQSAPKDTPVDTGTKYGLPELGGALKTIWDAVNYAPLALQESPETRMTVPSFLGIRPGPPQDAVTGAANWALKQLTPANIATLGVAKSVLMNPTVSSAAKKLVGGALTAMGLNTIRNIDQENKPTTTGSTTGLGSVGTADGGAWVGLPGAEGTLATLLNDKQTYQEGEKPDLGTPNPNEVKATPGQQMGEMLDLLAGLGMTVGGVKGMTSPVQPRLGPGDIEDTRTLFDQSQGQDINFDAEHLPLPPGRTPRGGQVIGEQTIPRPLVVPPPVGQGPILPVQQIPRIYAPQDAPISLHLPETIETQGAGIAPEMIGEQTLGESFNPMKEGMFQPIPREPFTGGKLAPVPVDPSNLRPAVQLEGKTLVGEPGDTHSDLLIRNGIDPAVIGHGDPRRGFAVPNGGGGVPEFLSRGEAQQRTGLKGSAEAGGLDSMDLPGAAMRRLEALQAKMESSNVEQKGQPNAIPELRTDSIPEAQSAKGVQPLEEKVRPGTEGEGAVRETQVPGQEGKLGSGPAFKLNDDYIKKVLEKIPPAQRDYVQAIFNTHAGNKDFEEAIGLNQLFGTGKMTDAQFEDLHNIPFKVRKDAGDIVAALRPKELQEAATQEIRKRFTDEDPKKAQQWEKFQKDRGNDVFRSGPGVSIEQTISDFKDVAKDAFKSFTEGGWTKEQMARLRDAVDNKASTPEQLTEMKKVWIGQLRDLKMPDGKAVVAPAARGTPPQGYVTRNLAGVRIAVHESAANMFDSLTADSAVQRNPVLKGIATTENFIKHKMLAFDLYHLFRIARRTFFLTGNIPRYAYKALIEMTPEEVKESVKRGEMDAEDQAFYDTKHVRAQRYLDRGLNVKKWAEQLGKPGWLESPFMLKGVDINPLSHARIFNNWVFNKVSRSAMLQVAMYEGDRIAKQHPEWSEEQQDAYVVRQSNIYLGNLGRQGFLRSATMRDLSQIAFLAPSWVEAMARSEAGAYAQGAKAVGNLAKGKLELGTQAKGVGTGIVAYLVANQIINMASRGQPTWENKEKGRMFDAYIPPIWNNSKGFFLSPFADSAEMTYDVSRYMREGKGPVGAVAKIAQNKLSPVARAVDTLRTGRDYAGRRLNEKDTIKSAAMSLVPTPLPITGLASGIPGQEQRQIMTTLGFKTEPYGRHEDFAGKNMEQRVDEIVQDRQTRKPDPASRVRAVEEAIFQQQERSKEVMSGLSRADRGWMESRGMSMPGFSTNIRIGNIEVSMTPDEQREMVENVKTETKKIIAELKADPSFTAMPAEQQQEAFNYYMRGITAEARHNMRERIDKAKAAK
jgi:hypothetical protein